MFSLARNDVYGKTIQNFIRRRDETLTIMLFRYVSVKAYEQLLKSLILCRTTFSNSKKLRIRGAYKE